MEKILKSPLIVHYELTDNCNHDCTHCYNSFDHTVPLVPYTTMKAIVEEVIQNEVFHAVVTGGEPFKDRMGLQYVLEEFTKNNMRLSLNTNLAMVNEDDIQMVRDNNVKSILTSVISYSPEVHDEVTGVPGSLKRTLKNMGIFASLNYGITANMVVNKNRVNDVYKTGKLAIENGARGFCATRMAPLDEKDNPLMLSGEDTELMLEQLLLIEEDFGVQIGSLNPLPRCFSDNPRYHRFQKGSCSGGRVNATIGQDGDLRACPHQAESYGNIVEEGMSSVWQKTPVLAEERVPTECGDCKEVKGCAGGCGETSRVVSGINSMDPLGRGVEHVQEIDQSLPEVNPNQRFSFREDIIYRDEKSGGVFYRKPSEHIVLPNKGVQVVKDLSQITFNINEVVEVLGEGIVPLVKLLYKKNLLKKHMED